MTISIERVNQGKVPDQLVLMIPFMFVKEEEACWIVARMSEVIVIVAINLIASTAMITTHQRYEFYIRGINHVNIKKLNNKMFLVKLIFSKKDESQK